MIRGELSNQPSLRFAVDYRVLLHEFSISKVERFIIDSGFKGFLIGRLKLKTQAEEWIIKNFKFKCIAFSIGCESFSDLIDDSLSVVSEIKHFDTKYSFFNWVRIAYGLVAVYTNDISLLGLDDMIIRPEGWGVIKYGL